MRSLKYKRPTYYTHFQCIASACEDNCCMGWFVDIDDKSYRKYLKIQDPVLKGIVKKSLKPNPDCDAAEINYATVNLTKDNNCAFLDDARLCRLQSILGEDHLSNVCTLYPRIYNQVNGWIEQSLSPSCPEALRQFLLSKEGISFEEGVAPIKLNILTYDVHQRAPHFEGTHVAQLDEVRAHCLSLLTDRSRGIEIRLAEIGRYIWGVTQSPISLKMPEDFMTRYDEPWMTWISKVFEALSVDETIVSERYRAWHFRARSFYKNAGPRELTRVRVQMQHFMTSNAHIFENYFVNHFFRNIFPYTEVDDLFEAYLLVIVRFAMMVYDLMGSLGDREDALEPSFSDAELVAYFQSFSKAIEHHHMFAESIIELLRRTHYNTFKKLMTL